MEVAGPNIVPSVDNCPFVDMYYWGTSQVSAAREVGTWEVETRIGYIHSVEAHWSLGVQRKEV